MSGIDLVYNLVGRSISENSLNKLIQATTCLESLAPLLELKRSQIQDLQCKKIHFSIDCVFKNTANRDLAVAILKNTLYVALEPDSHVSEVIKFCFEELKTIDDVNEALYALNLLDVVFMHYRNRSVEFLKFDKNQFRNIVLKVLKASSPDLNQFVLAHVVTNYFKLDGIILKNKLLKEIFLLAKTLKKPEMLCPIFDEFVADLENREFSLLARGGFWRLLMSCLVDQLSFDRKRAMYLLTKSVQFLFQNNLMEISQYTSPGTLRADLQTVWNNYFILLDVSSEKQLHLVQPSLKLLDSIQVLHPEWRLCLYRNFLRHSQKVISYRVALFMLQNERNCADSCEMIKEILGAINKNEYNSDSKRVCQEFSVFCSKLHENQFVALLTASLDIPWVPAAIWCLYNKIFVDTTSFRFPIILLEKVIANLKSIPHVFIRDVCRNLVLNYFARVCTSFNSADDFIAVADLMRGVSENQFASFVKRNHTYVLEHSREFHDDLTLICKNSGSNKVEITSAILNALGKQTPKLPNFTTFNSATDMIYCNLFRKYDLVFLENYVVSRINSLRNNEDVEFLLKLTHKLCTSPRIVDIAFTILLRPDGWNDAQRMICFAIISTNDYNQCNEVVQLWSDRIIKSNCEQTVIFFVHTLYNHFNKSSIGDALRVLENVLDRQNKSTVAVLENMRVVLNHVADPLVLSFVRRCFREFLRSIKGGVDKQFLKTFFTQIFDSKLSGHDQYLSVLLDFCFELLNVANNTAIMCLVSENVANLCERNPEKGAVFAPVIIELILFGIKVNKNERVEYGVCQEIMQRLSTVEDNPNFEEISARLWAYDAMLSLAKIEAVTNQFVSLLMNKYMINFNKRYFPDSELHIQKLRIIQALLLLHRNIRSEQLVGMIISSFLSESHQPSVKHLMQWLLILLHDGNDQFWESVRYKLKAADHTRPSTISGIIPVLYHLANKADVEQVMDILLPYTMGPQFKLRISSQVALLKLLEKTESQYGFLYKTLKEVVDASNCSLFDAETINREFLEYFPLKQFDHSSVFYIIPKTNSVGDFEWENLNVASKNNQFNNLQLDVNVECSVDETPLEDNDCNVENLQKKITPWKYSLESGTPNQDVNNCILVTSLVEKPANLGGLSRTCEIFGIKQMVMRTAKIASDKEFKSLSMSSENWVEFLEVKVNDLTEFLGAYKRKGYTIIGAEQTAESVKLEQFQFPERTVLVLGNEKTGIPVNVMPSIDRCVEIPQFGVVRSLNVHVAGAVIIWEYCKQHKL